MSIASLLGEIALATGPAGAVSLMRLRTFAVLLLALAGWLASRSKAPRFVIALLAAGDLLVLAATILAIGGPSGGMTSAVLVAALATIATVGVASVGRRQREDAPLAALPGALTVNLAAFEAIVALERGIGLGFVAPGPATMLAGSLAFALLGAALLIQTTEDALAAMPENTPVEQRALRLIVPLLMVAPAMITFAVWLIDRTMSSEYLPQITATTIQTVLIASVLLWLLGRLTRERRTLLEFTASVDLTPIALVDAEGRIVHWSKGCEELYGWPAEQAMGRPKHQLLQSRMVSGGGPIEASATGTELYERRRDGSFVQVLEKSLATPAGTGRPTRILSMTDLTERVTAERALRESEAHLTLAAHAHSIGIFDWEVDTGRMNWFGETERFLGLPIGTMRDYETWQSMVLPEDLEATKKKIDAAIWSKAERFSFFYRMRTPSGEIRAIEGSSRCFYDGSGNLLRTIGVNIDVTERVDRELQLAAREAQLRSIVDTIPDAMVVIDETGTIITFSRAASEMFGYSAKDAVGRSIGILMDTEHRDHHDAYLKRYLATGERTVIGQTRIMTARHADGHPIPIELRVGEASFNGLRVFTGFVRNITDRLSTEQRLDALRNELTHVGRLNAMGELAAGLAHEINQPLAAIANYMAIAETLLDRAADPEVLREQLAEARKQSLRAGQIIHRMRDFLSKHETESRVESVDAVVREAGALVLVGHEQLDVTVTYDLAPDAGMMFADRIQVQQVLVNLLRNSIDALRLVPRDRRAISVCARKLDEEMLEISVADTGPGIADSVLSQLYMPFTSTKGEGGMGVGLSICRRIVEAHGGSLAAENIAGGGAIFRFTLPRMNRKELSE